MRSFLFLFICFLLVGCADNSWRTAIIQKRIIISTTTYPKMDNHLRGRQCKTEQSFIQDSNNNKYVKVGNEKRYLPYKVNGKWHYQNIETGKPVYPSYKLRIK